MHRIILAVALIGVHAFTAQSARAQSAQTAQTVQSFIVKLKTESVGATTTITAATKSETPQALQLREQHKALAIAHAFDPSQTKVAPVGAGAHLIRLAAPVRGAELEQTWKRLREHPDVAWAEPNERLQRLAVPNDPGFTAQWHLHAPSTYAASLNLPAAWDKTTGATSVTVAVLDSGVRLNHPDLVGRLHPGYDFVSEVEYANDGDGRDSDPSDPGDWVSQADLGVLNDKACQTGNSSWHGTFIAGQIAAATNNSLGIAGVNWQGKVLPVRVSGKCGAPLNDVLDAMRWAAGLPVAGVPTNPNPAKIINLSFGGDSACTPAYQEAIDDIGRVGALLVVSAGNSSGPLRRPADCKGVLAVGAVQADGAKTYYSDFGRNVALMAPGGESSPQTLGIYSSTNDGAQGPGVDTYGYKTGTSFAAPLAAAVASLMLSVDATLKPSQLIACLKASAKPFVTNTAYPQCGTSNAVACQCATSTCGAGMLNASEAVRLASEHGCPPPASSTAASPVGGGGGANGVWAGLGLWLLALAALWLRRSARFTGRL